MKSLNRAWTEAEDKKLLDLWAKGKLPAIIGAALRRSPTAVISRYHVIKARDKAKKPAGE